MDRGCGWEIKPHFHSSMPPRTSPNTIFEELLN
jgi:hypothetical protein